MPGPASPFDRFTGGNAMMPARPQMQQPAAQSAAPSHHIPMHATRWAHAAANVDQATMIKKRDGMGEVMNYLASVAQAPEINRVDLAAYVGGMIRKGLIQPEEATGLLKALPEDQDGMRRWARVMLSAAMNTGIHAHAAYPREVYPGGDQPPEEPADV